MQGRAGSCTDFGLYRGLLRLRESDDLRDNVPRVDVMNDRDLLTVLFNFGRGCEVE